MEWIPVSERLPDITKVMQDFECSDDVLCINNFNIRFVARWSRREGNQYDFWNPVGIQGKISQAQTVTHWLEIPPLKVSF